MMLSRHARHRPTPARSGATMIECAFILPLLLLLFAGLAIGAAGVFRYQEVATLAREGARYGSTHGYQFRKDAGLPMGTSKTWRADIYNNAIKPRIVGLDSTRLLVTCTWPDVINQPGRPDNWPGSKIDVTVRYEWLPEGFLLGPYYLTSTSSMPITN